MQEKISEFEVKPNEFDAEEFDLYQDDDFLCTTLGESDAEWIGECIHYLFQIINTLGIEFDEIEDYLSKHKLTR